MPYSDSPLERGLVRELVDIQRSHVDLKRGKDVLDRYLQRLNFGAVDGCLGKAFDPFTVPFVRPLNGTLDVTGVASVMADSNRQMMEGRRHLLEQINHAAPAIETTTGMRNLDDASRRACLEIFEYADSPLYST